MDICKNLQQVTSLTQQNITDLVNIVIAMIGNNLYDSLQTGEDVCVSNLGFGEIHAKYSHEQSTIEYRFIPSADLEKTLQEVIIDKKDPMLQLAEESIKKEFTRIYKDLL